MRLFGVLNASPDSYHPDSVVHSVDDAHARAQLLLGQGADAFDLGGQASTKYAIERTPEEEWQLLEPLIPVLASYGREVSIDSWRPDVMRKGLEAGATWINAADGLQQPEMMELVAEFGCPQSCRSSQAPTR